MGRKIIHNFTDGEPVKPYVFSLDSTRNGNDLEDWSWFHSVHLHYEVHVVEKQRICDPWNFRQHFNVPPHGAIPTLPVTPNCYGIINSVRPVLLKKKDGGSKKIIRTPETLEALRNAIEQSPKHVQTLRMS